MSIFDFEFMFKVVRKEHTRVVPVTVYSLHLPVGMKDTIARAILTKPIIPDIVT